MKNESSHHAYAPVLITVYNRYEHVKECIESLKRCSGVLRTILYVASDAPGRDSDINDVEKVRAYLRSVSGFKKVEIIESKENLGPYRNAQNAINLVYESYDRLIRMEDDVIVGQSFLEFVNQGLQLYRDDPRVVAVCSYLPPRISNEQGLPFFLNSIAPYGFGRWREKDQAVQQCMNKDYISQCFQSFSFFRQYEAVSPHVARALPLLVYGGSEYRDIMQGVVMQSKGWLALFPPNTLTKTIGNDGSGVHAGIDIALMQQEVSNCRFAIEPSMPVLINKKLNEKIASYRRVPGIRIVNYIIYFVFVRFSWTYPLFRISRNNFKKIKTALRKR